MSISNTTNDKQYNGIKGWLIIFAISLITKPLYILYETYSTFSDIFSSGAWYLLTNPNSEFYHVLWKPAIIYGFFANLIAILMSFIVLYLFFKKSKHFPKTWMICSIIKIILLIIDLMLGSQIPLIVAEDLKELYIDLLQAILYLTVWGTYILKSKRIKSTFLK